MRFDIKSAEEIKRERGLMRGGRVQKFIDSECIRRMDPLTPKKTGTMIRSATFGTVKGTGKIMQTAPYSKKNYYHNGGYGMQGLQHGGKRGRKWFERMKSAFLKTILQGAAKLAGCKWRL